jgi:hypothetical protein
MDGRDAGPLQSARKQKRNQSADHTAADRPETSTTT